MFKHFLQSPAWETYEKASGHQTFRESTPDFEYLAVKTATKLGPYLSVPYGPSVRSSKADKTVAQKSFQKALESLVSLGKREHCVFIRIEPTEPFTAEFLAKQGLNKTKDIEPAHTWLLDLTPEKEELILGFSHGTRLGHNQFPRKNLSVEITRNPDDIKYLVNLQQALAKRKGITAYKETHLKTELEQPFASLYLVHLKSPEDKSDKVVAASLFFDDEENSTRFYMQSASDPTYKNLPTTVGLLCASLFDAKEKGLKYFDFWGIAPDGAPANHPWAGFTRFKKSFGGFARSYAGTWDLPLNKAKYSLYKKLRTVNRKLHKL